MDNKKNIKAEKYLSDFLKIAPLSHALWRACEAQLFDNIKFKKPILDLGCGFGEFAGVVFQKIEMGIDINDQDLVQALKCRKYSQVKWVDARRIPFKNNSYNSVISVSVLEHIEDVEMALKEINRILKKDGMLIFTVPTSEMPKGLLIYKACCFLKLNKIGERYCSLHNSIFKHVNLKNQQWWKNKLEKSGFEIMEIKGTISPALLKIHEIFLITALPSQLWKWLSGKRLLISSGLRSKILPIFFTRFTYPDPNCNFNLFIIAKKR